MSTDLSSQVQGSGSGPLSGRKVLVTRRREQAGELTRLLESAGAEVVLFPLIQIGPPGDWSGLDQCLAEFDQFDWVVFPSPNSVEFFFSRFCHLGKEARDFERIAVAAVGGKTAQCLEEKGIRPDLVPGEFSQEGLAAAFGKIPVQGKRILIPASSIGRTFLAESLERRGACVHQVVAYENRPPDPEEVEIPPDLLEGRIDWVVFASPSSVENFLLVLGRKRALRILSDLWIACIGTTTAEAVERNGLSVHAQPEKSSVPDLVQALCAHPSSMP